MPYDLGSRFAARTQRMRPSAIRDILKVSAQPDVISLAGGLPAPDLFPVDEYRAAFDSVLRQEGAAALQYGVSEGYEPLRSFLAGRLAGKGIACSPDEILITSGSQQALDLLGKVFLDPGDDVVIERPSYLGAIQAFDQYQPRYLVVPSDDHGMDVEELERTLIRRSPGEMSRVKFIYAIPNFQNPSGRTMSAERRSRLVEVASRFRLPIVEDDPYGELRYEGRDLPSLKSLDASGPIFYSGTFSKILAPGLRLGWLVAPTQAFRTLVLAKQPSDLHTSTCVQMATYELVRHGFLETHIPRLRDLYRGRRDAMVEAVDAQFPREVRHTRPQGGLFLWAELPRAIDTEQLLLDALREKVAFVPGASFHVDGTGANGMRLTFATEPADTIREAIGRLARAIERRLAGRDASWVPAGAGAGATTAGAVRTRPATR